MYGIDVWDPHHHLPDLILGGLLHGVKGNGQEIAT